MSIIPDLIFKITDYVRQATTKIFFLRESGTKREVFTCNFEQNKGLINKKIVNCTMSSILIFFFFFFLIL